MSYKVQFRKTFERDFKKLDYSVKRVVLRYIKYHLDKTDNPRRKGKALAGNLSGLWRYRIGDYRLIVEIRDYELTLLCLHIGHRKDIYK